jgi:FlaA1/EpsC-like NDP-sugar epimerase
MLDLKDSKILPHRLRPFHNIRAQLLDALIVGASYSFIFELRTISGSYDVNQVPFVLSAVLVTVLMMNIFGVYKRIWRYSSGYEITLLLKATAVSALILLLIAIWFAGNQVSFRVVISASLICFVGFAAVRYRSRLISGFAWRYRALVLNEYPKSSERVLIIGAGDVGQSLAMRLKYRYKDKRYKLVGFIDDDPAKVGMYVEGCRVLGTRHDIVRLATRHNVELIVVAIHNISGPRLREILSICEQTPALIKVVPDIFVGMNTSNQMMRPIEPQDLIGRHQVGRYEGIDFSTIIKRRVLVTGAAGSIGSELSRQICKYEPACLILVDNNESALHDLHIDLQAMHPQLKIVPFLVDVTQETSVEELFKQQSVDLVFHVAAYKHVPMLQQHPHQAIRNNIHGTLIIAKAAVAVSVERFVLISTDKAVKPSSVMGASKRICELILNFMSTRTDRTLFASVRFGNVLGSRGSVVPTFYRQLEQGGPLTVTSPDMTRYFMTIPEAANLIIHAAAITRGNDIFILKMGESVRILELAERIIRLRGLRPHIDIPVQFIGLRPGEKLHEELFYEHEMPLATEHPEILKVEPKSARVNGEIFWEYLDQLGQEVSENPALALESMMRFIANVEQPDRQVADRL